MLPASPKSVASVGTFRASIEEWLRNHPALAEADRKLFDAYRLKLFQQMRALQDWNKRSQDEQLKILADFPPAWVNVKTSVGKLTWVAMLTYKNTSAEDGEELAWWLLKNPAVLAEAGPLCEVFVWAIKNGFATPTAKNFPKNLVPALASPQALTLLPLLRNYYQADEKWFMALDALRLQGVLPPSETTPRPRM